MFVLWHRHTSWKVTDYKYIPRVCDLEETILCPRVMATNTFLPVTFSSVVNFLTIFYSTKRMSKRIKLCQKKR